MTPSPVRYARSPPRMLAAISSTAATEQPLNDLARRSRCSGIAPQTHCEPPRIAPGGLSLAEHRVRPFRTMSDEGFVSIESAARTTGISARTLRYWISTGKLTATAEKRGKRVSLADVERLGRMTGKVSSTAVTPMATVPTSAVAVSTDMMPAVDVALMIERLDALYREQIDAKNALVAQLEQRIGELEERQAATALPATAIPEQIDALHARLSALEAQHVISTDSVEKAPETATQRAWWRFWER